MGFLNDEFWPDDFWPDDYFPVYGDVDPVEELTFADMCTAILKITDGTTTVNLLDPDSGILLDSWIPALPGWKSGGIYTNNQLAEGRILQDAHRDNITESMTLNVRNTSMDAVIRDSQNLRRLLEKAVQYWTTNWQNDPVWIEAKGKEETNTRYAVIVNYATPSDVNPYAQPFAATQLSPYLMNGLALVLEHQPWTGNEPGTGTAVQLDTIYSNFGQEATTDPVIIATKDVSTRITHIYTYSKLTYTNILGSALPYTLFDSVNFQNDGTDAVYFGKRTSAFLGYCPFDNLIFDLGTAQNNMTLVWEYWDGAAWSTLLTIYTDLTQIGFAGESLKNTLGLGLFYFSPPTDWTRVAVNGVTGWWIRCRCSATTGAVTYPTQQNRDVYTSHKPFADINTSVTGDIPALLKFEVSAETATQASFMLCARSVDRGDDFTPYINLNQYTYQNPDGITVTDSVNMAFTDVITSPSGQAVFFNPTAYPESATAIIDIDRSWTETISDQYPGRYYMMIRGSLLTSTAALNLDEVSVDVLIENGAGNTLFSKSGFKFGFASDFGGGITDWDTIEVGNIEIPYTGAARSPITITVTVNNLKTSAPYPDAYFSDVILMPVDEFAAYCTISDTPLQHVALDYISALVDSITTPKAVTENSTLKVNDELTTPARIYYGVLTNIPGSMANLLPNKVQRLWIAQPNPGKNGTGEVILPMWTLTCQVNPRYLSMRGDR